jgi:ribosomal protein S18 acetylase RimI-like enzyme
MENASVSSAQSWSAEQFVIRTLNSSDVQGLRALHAELVPSGPVLRPAFFHQFLTHPTHLCLVVTLPSSNKPVACIAAAVHVLTTDLTPKRAPPPPFEVHVLALGVLPAFRRRGLATRLLQKATTNLRALAATAPQLPSPHATVRAGTRIVSDVARADSCARAFWKHAGLLEEEKAVPYRESWAVGWRDVVSVSSPIASAA